MYFLNLSIVNKSGTTCQCKSGKVEVVAAIPRLPDCQVVAQSSLYLKLKRFRGKGMVVARSYSPFKAVCQFTTIVIDGEFVSGSESTRNFFPSTDTAKGDAIV